MLLAARIVAGIVGALAVWAALLLTEKEEKELDRWLDDRWRQARMSERPAAERTAHWLRLAFELNEAVADAVFGKRLLSGRSLASALALSSASMVFMSGTSTRNVREPLLALCLLVFLIVAVRRRVSAATIVSGTVVVLLLDWAHRLQYWPTAIYWVRLPFLPIFWEYFGYTLVVATAGGVLLGYAWDLTYFTVARLAARRAKSPDSTMLRNGAMAICLAALGAVGATPYLLLSRVVDYGGWKQVPTEHTQRWGTEWGEVGFTASGQTLTVLKEFSGSNWVAFACGLAPLGFMLLLISHRLLHPLLATRIFDRLRRTDAKARTKFLLGVGGIAVAWAYKPEWPTDMVKVLEKLAG
jgi:hypothetical protein